MMSDLSMITDAVLKKAREEADNLIKEAEDKKNQMIAAAEKEADDSGAYNYCCYCGNQCTAS